MMQMHALTRDSSGDITNIGIVMPIFCELDKGIRKHTLNIAKNVTHRKEIFDAALRRLAMCLGTT